MFDPLFFLVKSHFIPTQINKIIPPNNAPASSASTCVAPFVVITARYNVLNTNHEIKAIISIDLILFFSFGFFLSKTNHPRLIAKKSHIISIMKGAHSIMKCNTWESRKENAILSGYGKTIQTFNHGRER